MRCVFNGNLVDLREKPTGSAGVTLNKVLTDNDRVERLAEMNFGASCPMLKCSLWNQTRTLRSLSQEVKHLGKGNTDVILHVLRTREVCVT